MVVGRSSTALYCDLNAIFCKLPAPLQRAQLRLEEDEKETRATHCADWLILLYTQSRCEIYSVSQTMCFSAKHKNCCVLLIPARPGLLSLRVIFFGGPDGSTKFRWQRSKIKGTYTSDWALARNGQKTGRAPENDPYLGNGKFLRGKL